MKRRVSGRGSSLARAGAQPLPARAFLYRRGYVTLLRVGGRGSSLARAGARAPPAREFLYRRGYVTLLRTRPALLLAIIPMPLVHSICAAGSNSEANEVASDSADDRIPSGPRLCLADEAKGSQAADDGHRNNFLLMGNSSLRPLHLWMVSRRASPPAEPQG